MTSSHLPGALEDRFRQLPALFWANQAPEAVGVDHRLLHASPTALRGMTEAAVQALVPQLGGHAPVDGYAPFASAYAGHQFGHYVPQLGDGRAVTIAEGRDDIGAPWEVQLKGSGRTPYSRFGDGRAVMRSSIREYLCSEHMAALGIPTTRALALLATQEGVQRETVEPGAIVARTAPSFLRFGHFEYAFHNGDHGALRQLADHVIEHFRPEVVEQDDPYLALFQDISDRTAALVASWQAVGFCHGVLNTDNMSILGLTIDYGPFGFLDKFDPGHICNHSDTAGRYAFAEQPRVVLWNLYALASCFTSLTDSAGLETTLKAFPATYEQGLHLQMCRRVGVDPDKPESKPFWADLLALMQASNADYHQPFAALARLRADEEVVEFSKVFPEGDSGKAAELASRYHDLIDEALAPVVPRTILRNWVAESVIRALEDEGDLGPLCAVFDAVVKPFDSVDTRFSGPAPAEYSDLSVSCSS